MLSLLRCGYTVFIADFSTEYRHKVFALLILNLYMEYNSTAIMAFKSVDSNENVDEIESHKCTLDVRFQMQSNDDEVNRINVGI